MDLAEKPTSVDGAVVAHYQLVAPAMEQNFGRIPIVWTTPVGWKPPTLDALPEQWHGKWFGHWSHLSAEHVVYLASIGAQEFYSWFPLPEDPKRARFARFLLERPNADTTGTLLDSVRRAAVVLRDQLQADGFGAIPVLDAVGGVALFVPLADGPDYANVRMWAHGVARAAITSHPDLLSEAPNVLDDGCVHIHVSSNAEGRGSMLPYSFRVAGRRIATPVRWDELAACDMYGAPIEAFARRFAAVGDVFGEQLRAIDPRPLPPAPHALTEEAVDPVPPRVRGPHKHRHGEIVSSVSAILADGKARTAAEIWKIAHERGLACSDTVGDLSNNVWSYIERQTAHGFKPVIVATADHKFRINEPPDEWPDAIASAAKPAVDIEALIARLTAAATESENPEHFEIAVCDAFAAMGLLTNHVGGLGAPDGYADAPLGTLGYRVMFECKSGTTLQKSPNIFEASKFREAYGAKYCALIGSQSGSEQQEALSEIKTHGVSLWGADDIVYALRAGLNANDLQAAFAPGAIAQDVLPDIVWARDHGVRKRVRLIAEIIQQVGWTTQCAAAQANSPADAPLLTEDAAMLLVDQELAALGAHVNCTREEVRLAFGWLTNPLVGAAVAVADMAAIIIVDCLEEK